MRSLCFCPRRDHTSCLMRSVRVWLCNIIHSALPGDNMGSRDLEASKDRLESLVVKLKRQVGYKDERGRRFAFWRTYSPSESATSAAAATTTTPTWTSIGLGRRRLVDAIGTIDRIRSFCSRCVKSTISLFGFIATISFTVCPWTPSPASATTL